MEPSKNPFAPGAGTPPPELAGRDELLSEPDILCVELINLTGCVVNWNMWLFYIKTLTTFTG